MRRLIPLLLAASIMPLAARAASPAPTTPPHHHPAKRHRPHHHVIAIRRHPARARLAASGVTMTVLAAAILTPKPAATPPADRGSETGLQLPRFAALHADRVSFRVGPGTQYPIEWIYQRRSLPVKIEREFEVWRLVAEPDGTRGWVHEAMLTGHRGFLIIGDQPQTLRAEASDSGRPVAILKPGVVGRLIRCPAGDWCEVHVQSYRGWLPRGGLWGALPGEIVNP